MKRGCALRTKAARRFRSEKVIWHGQTADMQRGLMVSAARAMLKSAAIQRGLVLSAENDQRHDVLRRRTAAMQRGWELSAVIGDDKGRGRVPQVEAGCGFGSETACSICTDRGHAARVEAIRGRYQNCLSICFSGQTRVCRVDPVRVLNLYKYF